MLGALGATAFAASQEPMSKDQAKAIGDPSATAPAAPAPSSYLYNGAQIAPSVAVAKQLFCLDGDPTTNMPAQCFDTGAQFESIGLADTARSLQSQGVSVSTARNHLRHSARAAACGQIYLVYVDFDSPNYAGTPEGVTGVNYWQTLGFTNNHVSSYTTGEHAAHLAENNGGGGYYYPGNTSYCSNNSIPAHYPAWDNRISSVYRY